MLKKNFLNLVGAGCRTLLIAGSSMVLILSACSTESAPAAKDAPKRTMAPEETEPEVEAIDARRVEASSKVVVEQEPAAMPEAEMTDMEEATDHDHAGEPAEEMQEGPDMCPEGAMCADEKPATMAAVKPASKPATKPKSLIR